MRGLVRLFVVGFTVITLMMVAAVGVSATSGSAGSAHTFDSVVGLISGHSDLTGTTNQNNGNGDGNQCPPEKKHHFHRTGGHKHHPCDDGDPGEDDSS